jgi:hypothetical protein
MGAGIMLGWECGFVLSVRRNQVQRSQGSEFWLAPANRIFYIPSEFVA